MKKFNPKHFRNRLQKLLEFGAPNDWFAVGDRTGEIIFTCEIVDPSESSNLADARNWDIESFDLQDLEKPFLAIASRGRDADKLIAIFEKGERIPHSVLSRFEPYLQQAHHYDVSGSAKIFPHKVMDTKIFILLTVLLVLTISLMKPD